MPEFVLVDSDDNPESAEVDQVALERGGAPQSLTKSQVERLVQAGVRVREVSKPDKPDNQGS